MTLPFQIGVWDWIGYASLFLLVLWIYTRDRTHFIRQLISLTAESNAQGWKDLLRIKETPEQARRGRERANSMGRIMVWFFLLLTAVYASLSLMVLAGVLKNPPSRWAVPDDLDSTQYELVIHGHTISARKKVEPTTFPASSPATQSTAAERDE